MTVQIAFLFLIVSYFFYSRDSFLNDVQDIHSDKGQPCFNPISFCFTHDRCKLK